MRNCLTALQISEHILSGLNALRFDSGATSCAEANAMMFDGSLLSIEDAVVLFLRVIRSIMIVNPATTPEQSRIIAIQLGTFELPPDSPGKVCCGIVCVGLGR